jgi:anti-sigma B factor antagonist
VLLAGSTVRPRRAADQAQRRARQQRRSAQPYSWQQEVTQVRDGRCLFEVVNGVPVVRAPEEIDITNAPELRSALLEAAAHGHGTLVVDMTRTQFCDSSGLHTLLAAHKRAQAEGGEVLLAITAAPVLRVFALTSIDRVIPNFTSLDEALAQTSANRSNGHQRADVLGRNELVARPSTALANSTEKPADRDAASVIRTVPDLLLPVMS